MSYSVAQPGAAKKRPGAVSAASALLYVCTFILLVQATLGFLQIGPVRQVVNDFYADRDPAQADAANVGFLVGIIGVGVVYVLLAVALIVLAMLIRRGKNPARIVTWVLAGIGVLCIGCGVALGAASNSLTGVGGNSADQQALSDAMADVVPAWQNTLGTALQIVALVLLVVIIVLLALPASNDFFRKEQEVWVPPTTWPGDTSGMQPPYLPPAPGSAPPPYNPGPPPPPPGR